MISIATGIAVFGALFAAPLVLGSFVIVQRSSWAVAVAWFGFLTLLLGLVVAAGGLALAAHLL